MDQRHQFALESLHPAVNMSELCASYGISRRTGYKWKERFLEEGLQGLLDQSRRPHNSPGELSEIVVCALIRLKQHHPSWGPPKIHTLYERLHGKPPSLSSVKRVLERAGMVQKRKRRKRPSAARLREGRKGTACNEVWTVDFKGWWHTADGNRCEPLTVRDEFSRYVLEVRALSSSRCEHVRACFERLFQRYGLPEAIRSDNGPPFAAPHALLGLSKLSAWWLALGIHLERGRPGKPQDNGAHERLHRDIKAEIQAHARGNQREQQHAFDIWRETFNNVRPHEALGQRTPAEFYEASPRKWTSNPFDIAYEHKLVRRVNKIGVIAFNGQRFHLSGALSGWSVGLDPIDNDRYEVTFAHLNIGHIDLSTNTFLRAASGPEETQPSKRHTS